MPEGAIVSRILGMLVCAQRQFWSFFPDQGIAGFNQGTSVFSFFWGASRLHFLAGK